MIIRELLGLAFIGIAVGTVVLFLATAWALFGDSSPQVKAVAWTIAIIIAAWVLGSAFGWPS